MPLTVNITNTYNFQAEHLKFYNYYNDYVYLFFFNSILIQSYTSLPLPSGGGVHTQYLQTDKTLNHFVCILNPQTHLQNSLKLFIMSK